MIIVMMAILITKYNSSAIRSTTRSSCAYVCLCMRAYVVLSSLFHCRRACSSFFLYVFVFYFLLRFYYECFGYTVCICPFYSHVDRCIHLMSWCLIVNVNFFFISFVLLILFCFSFQFFIAMPMLHGIFVYLFFTK